VREFTDYLEYIGMGAIRFTREDFLAFDGGTEADRDLLRSAGDRLVALGQDLLPELSDDHKVKRQMVSPDYVGVNLFDGQKPINVPHLSVGLGRRELSVFLTVESKGLVQKLIQAEKRDPLGLEYRVRRAAERLTGSGWAIIIHDKWHFTSGGRGVNQSTWFVDTKMPFEVLVARPGWVQLVWARLKAVTSKEHRKETVRSLDKYESFGGRTAHACLGFAYLVPWYVVDQQGTEIAGTVQGAIKQLLPMYELMRELTET